MYPHDRMSRLLGECSKVAYYVRSSKYVYVPGGRDPHNITPKPKRGVTGRPPKYKPGHKKWLKPRPARPTPLPASVPFKPMHHSPLNPFGQRVPIMPGRKGGLGGLAPKYARKLLRFAKPWPLTAFLLLLDFTEQQPEGGMSPYDFNGWTLRCESPPVGGSVYNAGIPYSGIDTRSTYGGSSPGLPCTQTGQVALDTLTNGVNTLPAGTRWVALGPDSHTMVVRMQLRKQMSRLAPLPTPALAPQYTYPRGQGQPTFIPSHPWPAVDPFSVPPMVRTPPPHPIPFTVLPGRRPNPDRSPTEQPGGSEPSVEPTPTPETGPWPGSSGGPVIVVGPPPPNGPTTPSAPVGGGWKWGWHRSQNNRRPDRHRKRNRKRSRDKKLITSMAPTSVLAVLMSLVTESLDALNAFYKALPRELQPRGLNPFEKLQWIVDHLDQVRVGTLVANLVSEMLEDEGYGKLSRIVAQANRNLRQHFERGPGDTLGSNSAYESGALKASEEPMDAFYNWLETQYNAL